MNDEDKVDLVAATAWVLFHVKNAAEVSPLDMFGLAAVALKAIGEERARLLTEPNGRM